MKIRATLIMVLVVMLLVSACGSATPSTAPAAQPTNTMAPAVEPTNPPTPTPTTEPTSTAAMPTDTPATSGDPVWDRVLAARKLVVGTSADYRPFEYYDASNQIIGFDAALVRQIGAQLGLDVELVDIAFEGLPAALLVGQVDIAIAAISVTPERQTILDFTNVYYSGQDAILARAGSGIPTIVAPAQLAQYRVAAQRGSIYGTWVQKTLIEPGLMPQTNLLLYDKAGEAVRDLRENRNDLVILDKLAADEYVLSGGVVSVGGNLNRQLFAIALPKGAPLLLSQLNNALTTLQNNGTIAQLTEDYLNLTLPPVTQTPLPTATPLPGPTPTPVPCYDSMEFRRDLTVPDGTRMSPGQNFDKTWRIRNTGNCVWNKNYKLVFVQGDRMGGNPGVVTSRVNPGNAFDVTVKLQAPKAPGNYSGLWQMVNANGVPFGERIWVKITVPGNVPPTAPPPTATLVPPVQPTLAPGPVVEYLRVSKDTIQQGDPIIVSWSFSGKGLLSARLTRTNPDGSRTLINNGADVAPRDQYEDLLVNPGLYSYTLNLASEFGSTTVKTVVVNVTPRPGVELQEIEWKLVRFINPVKPDEILTPLDGTELTIKFSANGSVSGSTGCNPFRTTFELLDANRIKISDQLNTGQALCDQAVTGQEALYMDLLIILDAYEIRGNQLVLKAQNPDPAQTGMLDIFTFQRR